MQSIDFPEVEILRNSELFKNCTNVVVGKGNSHAEILFVGEAPGRNEDLQGLPFVGAAGKNLDKLLEKVGLSLNDIYVANINVKETFKDILMSIVDDEIFKFGVFQNLLKKTRNQKPKNY